MQIFIFIRNVILKKYDRRYLQGDVNVRIMHTPLPKFPLFVYLDDHNKWVER